MRLAIDKVHADENEVNQLKEQLSELQKALSDSHLAVYDEKNYLLQLSREFNLLQNQEINDTRKMQELNNLVTEVSDGSLKSQENSQRYVNFKDCRPSSKMKAAGKKPNAPGGVNGIPKPNQTQ